MKSAMEKVSVILVLLALLGAAFFFSFYQPIYAIAPKLDLLSGDSGIGYFSSGFLEKLETEKLYSKLTPTERKFVLGSEKSYGNEWIKELYETEPENVLYTSLYAVTLLSSFDPEWKPELEKIRPVLEQWKKIDPENGMPWFLGAYMEILSGYKEEKITKENMETFRYSVTNKAAIDRGLKEYYSGLTKKYAKAYALARQRERQRLVNAPKTPFGVIKKIEIAASTRLPHLSLERDLARYLGDYARKLHTAGKIKEAEELIASGRTYLLLRLKEQETFLISQLVHIAINTIWLEAAKDIKNPELEAIYTPLKEFYEQWKKLPDPNAEIAARHGGILTAMLIPVLKKKIDPEFLKPERMVNYLLLDQCLLGIFFTYILFVIAILFIIGVVGLCFKKFPDWQELPRRSLGRIFLIGFGIPILLYLIYIHVDLFSGRNMNPSWNPLRTAVPYLYLLFCVPLAFFVTALVELKCRLRKTFFPILWNQIALMIIFLFLTSGILTAVFRMEINYYIEKDQLCNTDDGFTSLEVGVCKDFLKQMEQDLTKKK